MTRDLGDRQTPPALATAVLAALHKLGLRWSRALEPACGDGVFLAALSDRGAAEIVGIEMQSARWRRAAAAANGAHVLRGDVFEIDLGSVAWRTDGPLLVVGNPPWVTASELGSLRSNNLPPKSNFVGLRGLDARTGAANFDLAEFIALKAVRELVEQQPAIALLCKTTSARRVLEYCAHARVGMQRTAVMRIDAPRWFGANVDACLLVMELGGGQPVKSVPVFASLDASQPARHWGFDTPGAVADHAAYQRVRDLDGVAPLIWHQGVKHDAASVLELHADGRRLRNGLDEIVDVEATHVYPLLKGADVNRDGAARVDRRVIVTQRDLRDDTHGLAQRAPKLWCYLCRHRERFAARRSSVYRGRPEFSMFGIGPYAFAAHKVAVSGLHKRASFRALSEIDGKPVLLDDTCYFVACSDAAQASAVAGSLNGSRVQAFISAVAFWEAKRPLTKRLLSRIDWSAAR